jgi:hypothetical protein
MNNEPIEGKSSMFKSYTQKSCIFECSLKYAAANVVSICIIHLMYLINHAIHSCRQNVFRGITQLLQTYMAQTTFLFAHHMKVMDTTIRLEPLTVQWKTAVTTIIAQIVVCQTAMRRLMSMELIPQN